MSNGYILMDPRFFLDLTTNSQEERLKMMSDSNTATLDEYNRTAQAGESVTPPFLQILCDGSQPGKVSLYDGRHRACACIKANVNVLPVFLIASFGGQVRWRMEKRLTGRPTYEYRYVDASDFPSIFIGKYLPISRNIDMSTWVDIR